MIPVYDAQEFISVMHGGSTFPWQVLVNANGESVPYVIKLYDREYQKHDIVMKEIIASNLASQFDIGTTNNALIRITKDFVRTLNPAQLTHLHKSGFKAKFGTKLIEPAVIYSSSKPHNVLDKVDKANIYAFDNLILHRDRRFVKPNILINKNSYHIIDNENCLSFPQQAKKFLEGNNVDYLYNDHIFKKELKTLHDKSSLFDTFEYYLSNVLNLENLDFITDFLGEFKHPCGSFFDVIDYLKSAKQLSPRFVKHLRFSIE